MKRSALPIAAAGVFGAVLGGFALTSAGTDSSTEEAEMALGTVPWPTALPATSGREPLVFSSSLGVLDNGTAEVSRAGVTIQLRRSDTETCFDLSLPSGTDSAGCFDDATLQSGFAYGAYRDHGWPLVIIGVVPDDVAGVEIAGEAAAVINNIWIFEANDGDDLAFTVVGRDGERVTLGES